MVGRWETLILLLCELPASVCTETVDQQREEVQDEKQRRSAGAKKKDHFVVCHSNERKSIF